MVDILIMKLIWRFIVALGPMSSAMLARQSRLGQQNLIPQQVFEKKMTCGCHSLEASNNFFWIQMWVWKMWIVTATKVAGLHDGRLGGWTRFCQGECSCHVLFWGGVAHRRGRQCANLEDHPETLKNSEGNLEISISGPVWNCMEVLDLSRRKSSVLVFWRLCWQANRTDTDCAPTHVVNGALQNRCHLNAGRVSESVLDRVTRCRRQIVGFSF